METFDCVITGAGIMGAAAACEAAREGARVALMDQTAIPNPRAASVDHSKVFRFAYPDSLYVRLAIDALARWRALEQETGARLLTETGLLMIGQTSSAFEIQSFETLRSLGCEAEMLDGREATRRFPQFNADAFPFAVYDPSGAILQAEQALRALVKLARNRGVTVIENQRAVEIKQSESKRVLIVSDGGKKLKCKRAMIASGPWTRKLLPVLDDKLTTTLQEIVYFEPHDSQMNFEPGAFPIFIELTSGFYGFPVHHARAMKIANHHKGPPIDPYSFDEQVSDDFIQRCRAFFSEFIPHLAEATVKETRVCIYNNTRDDDFIIDWHTEIENALIVTGFSGHGFKFATTIGRIGAELLLSGRTEFDIERFSLARFR